MSHNSNTLHLAFYHSFHIAWLEQGHKYQFKYCKTASGNRLAVGGKPAQSSLQIHLFLPRPSQLIFLSYYKIIDRWNIYINLFVLPVSHPRKLKASEHSKLGLTQPKPQLFKYLCGSQSIWLIGLSSGNFKSNSSKSVVEPNT